MDMNTILGYFGAMLLILITGAILYMISAAVFKFGPFLPFCSKHLDICKHSGICINLPDDDYRCDACNNGWKGKDCDEVDRDVVSNRPCEKDDPCEHGSTCKNIDTNSDGIMDDYECDCSEIKDGMEWEGKQCNDIPNNLTVNNDDNDDDDYDPKCNKADGEKRLGFKKCESTGKCIKEYKIHCKDACTPTTWHHRWCPEKEKCIDRSKESCPSDDDDDESNHCSKSERWNYSIKKCECDTNFNCRRWSAADGPGGTVSAGCKFTPAVQAVNATCKDSTGAADATCTTAVKDQVTCEAAKGANSAACSFTAEVAPVAATCTGPDSKCSTGTASPKECNAITKPTTGAKNPGSNLSTDGNKDNCHRAKCCEWDDAKKSCDQYKWFENHSSGRRGRHRRRGRVGHRDWDRDRDRDWDRDWDRDRDRDWDDDWYRHRGDGFVVGGFSEY